MVRNSGVLISGKNLGETEFFACSCSNAAAQMRGTVLSGNNISNITWQEDDRNQMNPQ